MDQAAAKPPVPPSEYKPEGSPRPGAVASQPDDQPDATFRMEDVVRRTGLTPRAIRYYEEMGLLAPSGRTAGGFRLYTEAEIAQLLKIKELQTLLGFSLAEIKETLHAEAVRAELRQAYAQATDPRVRLELLEQGAGLVHSQMRIIDERMARLAKLREEYREREERLRTLREQVTREAQAEGTRA